MGEGVREVDLLVLGEVDVTVSVEVVLVDYGGYLFHSGVHAQNSHGFGQFLLGESGTSKVMLPSPLMSNLLKIFLMCSSSSGSMVSLVSI